MTRLLFALVVAVQQIEEGEFLTLLGPSGCGKTTLLKTILGTHPVDSGNVQLNGDCIGNVKPGTIGYVPQLGSVDWSFPVTVEEVIMMGLYTGKRILPWSSKAERRALVNNPKLLVLDEPTSGVDIKTQHEILHLLSDINSEGITILLTTHDLNAVASHLPWVICFNNGLVAQGQPRDIFTNEILTRTYGGDIVIVKHNGYLLIANSTPLNLMGESR